MTEKRRDLHYLELPKCLGIPVPFILQERPDSDLSDIVDSNGWNMMHWAIALSDVKKVNELLECGMTFKSSGNAGAVPKDAYATAGLEEIPNLLPHPPFSSGGASPLHLSAFIYKEVENKAALLRNKISYDLFNKRQFEIFSKASPNDMSATDRDGFSVTDWCLLTENVKYALFIAEFDPSFDSLKKVSDATALRIIEIHLKHKCSPDAKERSECERMLNILKAKERKSSLNSKLPVKIKTDREISKI